jgi:hypothetical protein
MWLFLTFGPQRQESNWIDSNRQEILAECFSRRFGPARLASMKFALTQRTLAEFIYSRERRTDVLRLFPVEYELLSLTYGFQYGRREIISRWWVIILYYYYTILLSVFHAIAWGENPSISVSRFFFLSTWQVMSLLYSGGNIRYCWKHLRSSYLSSLQEWPKEHEWPRVWVLQWPTWCGVEKTPWMSVHSKTSFTVLFDHSDRSCSISWSRTVHGRRLVKSGNTC